MGNAKEFQGSPNAKAIMSLMDIVEELADQISTDEDWLEVLHKALNEHRQEIRIDSEDYRV